jgi:hypothetical protein
MLHDMRRLHPRGPANRGICVDADGAMLGPECILVRRTPRGYRGIERPDASALQKCVILGSHDDDWLFSQAQRIAEALDKGEIALAQIYGLRIPVGNLDERVLKRLPNRRFAKGYNPDEPRIPKHEPHGGEWTTGSDGDASGSLAEPFNLDAVTSSGSSGAGADDGANTGAPGSPAEPSSPHVATSGSSSGAGADDGANTGAPGSLAEPSSPHVATSGSSSGAGADDGANTGAPTIPEVTPGDASLSNDGAGNEGGPASANNPPTNFERPLSNWPSTAGVSPIPGGEGSPATLEGPDVSEVSSGAASSTEATGAGEEGGPQPERTVPPSPEIPTAEPATAQQRNPVLRSVATWLGSASASLGSAFQLDPRVRALFATIEAPSWVADYLPKVLSYLDEPKTLQELQNAVGEPGNGYETHHIVEAQKNSAKPQSNARRFPDRVDSRENLVRVPYWKHVEISAWYSKPDKRRGGLSPRDSLRGKSWEDQYKMGIDKLKDFGVLK